MAMEWMAHEDYETFRLYAHISPGTNRFKNPSIFAVKDILKLLDAPREQQAPVVPLPQRKRRRKGEDDGPRVGRGQ